MQVLSTFIESVAQQIIDPLIMLLAAGAFIVFLWGLVKFIANAQDETARAEGRQAILYGLIGLVIIFGVFGIINIITATFGINNPVQPGSASQQQQSTPQPDFFQSI